MTNVTNRENNKRRQLSWDLSYTGLLILLFFRIPLTNIIGNEGNGYYFISFEIFTFFYLIFGFCFHQITYELIRKNIKKYTINTRTTLFILLNIIGLVTSILGAGILFISSKWILGYLHMELSIISLRLLCVWLIISSLGGIYRGYFEACGSNIPTAFSKIIEAIVAGTGSLIFATSLSNYGSKVSNLLFNQQYKPAFGATGIICGLICGSLFSFVFLFLVYQFYQRYQKNSSNTLNDGISKKTLCFSILKMFFACIFSLIFMYSYRLVNLFLYVSTLSKQIQEEQNEINILSLVGSYHGKVLVLVGIIILIILSISGTNILKVRKLYSKNKYEGCWKCVLEDIKHILYITIPTCVLIFVFSEQIFNVFYGKANMTEINFLKIESICIVLIPLSMYLYRVMKKINLNLELFILPLIGFIVQSVLMYVLVASLNTRMLSIVIAEVVFWFLVFIMELVIILNEFNCLSLNKKLI